VRRALKTDLFEEAFGGDALLPDLLGASEIWLAMDLAAATVRKARLRARRPVPQFLAADARRLPRRTASIDLVLSTSTLDHFDSRREFVAAIAEIARVLRPGRRLVLTIDNPSNPRDDPRVVDQRFAGNDLESGVREHLSKPGSGRRVAERKGNPSRCRREGSRLVFLPLARFDHRCHLTIRALRTLSAHEHEQLLDSPQVRPKSG
jgi:SAM-dependent methyltransferase